MQLVDAAFSSLLTDNDHICDRQIKNSSDLLHIKEYTT